MSAGGERAKFSWFRYRNWKPGRISLSYAYPQKHSRSKGNNTNRSKIKKMGSCKIYTAVYNHLQYRSMQSIVLLTQTGNQINHSNWSFIYRMFWFEIWLHIVMRMTITGNIEYFQRSRSVTHAQSIDDKIMPGTRKRNQIPHIPKRLKTRKLKKVNL